MLRFCEVTKDDYRFLFNLLAERESWQNISHKAMPTWAEHVRFCKSNPYPMRRIIKDGKRKIGTLYVTIAHEVGVFITKKYTGLGYGSAAIDWLIKSKAFETLYANINPANEWSKRLFTKYGFKHIQDTYRREGIGGV